MKIDEWFKNAYGSYWDDRPKQQSWNKAQLETMYDCAFSEGHQQGFKEGFNEGRKLGMESAANIAKRYMDLDWYTSEEIAVAINIEEAIRETDES